MSHRSTIAAVLLGTASMPCGLTATAASDTGASARAAAQFKSASKALDKQQVAKAIAAAEAAVALDPRNAGYRTLLGRAYLAAGRFPSAVGALNDALSLDPSSGEAALHLALAQIATGEWDAARETLSAHAAGIPASDHGLALALAGDPEGAVAMLTLAARAPEADAKTRQNLALSLALAGRWMDAKTIASLDMAPDEVDARIMQWAAFARPNGAADQVAALLGVVPVVDGGQPERLALNAATSNVAAAQTVAPVAPVDAFMPTQVAEPAPTAPAPDVGAPVVTTIGSAIVFADRLEVVQAVPAATPVRAAVRQATVRTTVRVRPAAGPVATTPASGNFYVQLGAFESSGVARDAWGRLSRRVASLGRHVPQGINVTARGQGFYRLSVGGLARGDADALCRKVRNSGNVCFVRARAGDQAATWAGKGVRLAVRKGSGPAIKKV